MCSFSLGGGEVALKLALNVFMYGVLLGRGYVDHKLDMNYFHVVENQFVFNSFPWGRHSYDFMVSEFFDSAIRLNTLIKENQKPSVVVNGFILALQVWAFIEVYPEIGNACAFRYNHFDPTSPRLFQWASYKSVGYKVFQSFLDKSPLMRMVCIFTYLKTKVYCCIL